MNTKDEGEYFELHPNGSLFIHCFYKNGKRHGEFTSFHENTTDINIHCFYVDGKIEGEYKDYWESIHNAINNIPKMLMVHAWYINNKFVENLKNPSTHKIKKGYILGADGKYYKDYDKNETWFKFNVAKIVA